MRGVQKSAKRLYACVRLLLLILVSLFLPRVFLLHSKRESEKNKNQISNDDVYFVDSVADLQEDAIQQVCSCRRCAVKNNAV